MVPLSADMIKTPWTPWSFRLQSAHNRQQHIRILSQEGSIRRLRSLNVIDPDIVVNEQEQLQCIGKILGKVYGSYEICGTCEEDETIPEHEIEIQ